MLAAFNVADASDIELDELVALVAEMENFGQGRTQACFLGGKFWRNYPPFLSLYAPLIRQKQTKTLIQIV